LRLYPHLELPVEDAVAELGRQGRAAVGAGFDGVMTSEHHNGFAGYLPNPLQAAGWLLDEMPSGWAAPCPLLLPLRPAALVAEEVAWLAARFPGRVGVGLAAGSLPGDFVALGVPQAGAASRFAAGLALVAAALRGEDAGPLRGDPAVDRCRRHPVPVLSAANSPAAARRAAAYGTGLLFDSLSSTERCRDLVEVYRANGGPGPVVLIRRAWVGEPPEEQLARQVDVYRGYAPSSAQAHWSEDQVARGVDAAAVADAVAGAVEAAGADAVNLRVHVPGLRPDVVRAQIDAFAAVVPLLRARFPGAGDATHP
jgi:alkanesulfonate monooxygenase SsuD/methylene tetrahydromethanopterin reductase-like flavin-dependent oxidoreductase (luciferase family)